MNLVSTVPPEEIAARLAAITSSRQPWFKSPAGEYEFVGEITSASFRLSPVIRGRNAYLPRVSGTMRPVGVRTEIEITQSLRPIAAVAVCAWFVVIIGALLRAGNWKGAAGNLALLVLLHSLMYAVGFVPEAARVEKRLAQIVAPLLS